MKREFLANIKVGETPLPKEIIDMILDEHSRSVGAVRTELENVRGQLQTAKDGLKAFEGVDVAQLQGRITQLQSDLQKKDADHQAQLADMAFDRSLEAAIDSLRGRSKKAIKALLDIETLKKSTNQDADIKAALEEVKKDSGYLFDGEGTPPPYARGTGVQTPSPANAQATLAGALRERYNK